VGSRQCIAQNLATAGLHCAVYKIVLADLLKGASAVQEKIELAEWFNSAVKGGGVELEWKLESREA